MNRKVRERLEGNVFSAFEKAVSRRGYLSLSSIVDSQYRSYVKSNFTPRRQEELVEHVFGARDSYVREVSVQNLAVRQKKAEVSRGRRTPEELLKAKQETAFRIMKRDNKLAA